MIRVKVEYDAYNRRFKLIDREFGSILEDGATYELSLPFMLPDLYKDGELISVSEVTSQTASPAPIAASNSETPGGLRSCNPHSLLALPSIAAGSWTTLKYR